MFGGELLVDNSTLFKLDSSSGPLKCLRENLCSARLLMNNLEYHFLFGS